MKGIFFFQEVYSHLYRESFEETPLKVAVITYIAYAILIVFGYLRDFLRNTGFETVKKAKENPKLKVSLTEIPRSQWPPKMLIVSLKLFGRATFYIGG